MTLFDTHAHFASSDPEGAASEIERAAAAGFSGIMAVGSDHRENSFACRLSVMFPGFVRAAVGLDRDLASGMNCDGVRTAVSQLERDISEWRACGADIAAIGEIGLDYAHGPEESVRQAQCSLFAAQLELAARLALPVSVHSREAGEDTLRILREHGSSELAGDGKLGVIHCFTDSVEFAREAASLGMFFGVGGIITFRNADALRGRVRTLPRGRIVIETDCPYLAPVPVRGKKCEPVFAEYTALKLSEILGIDVDETARMTSANAVRLFG